MGNNESTRANSPGSFDEYDKVISHLNYGDLIEIKRNNYKHWVLYHRTDPMGNVWCYHMTYPEANMSGTSAIMMGSASATGCAALKYDTLKHILSDNEERIPSPCRINNQKAIAEKMLQSSGKRLPNLNEVFNELNEKKDKLFEYNLKSNNCEHYCTLWKYGIRWSSQWDSVEDTATTAVFAGLVAGLVVSGTILYRSLTRRNRTTVDKKTSLSSNEDNDSNI